MQAGKILPYLDIPFQHASPKILKAMKRPAATEDTLARIRAWRAACPELVIRSTFIVGFPGETEEDFRILLDFLEAAQLDRVGCFPYSPVEGAAAGKLADPVPEDEAGTWNVSGPGRDRAARLERRIGQTMTVLVDEIRRPAPPRPQLCGCAGDRRCGDHRKQRRALGESSGTDHRCRRS
jgi:ribosomal protein S12 methylthiotransferase